MSDLAELLDKQAITETCYRYGIALDSRDWATLATCFTPDAGAYLHGPAAGRWLSGHRGHLPRHLDTTDRQPASDRECHRHARWRRGRLRQLPTGTTREDRHARWRQFHDRGSLSRSVRAHRRGLANAGTAPRHRCGRPAIRPCSTSLRPGSESGAQDSSSRRAASGVSRHIWLLSNPIRPSGTTSSTTRRGELRCRTKAAAASGSPGRTAAARAG